MIGAEINRPNDELEAINEVAIKIYGGGGKATLIEHLVAKESTSRYPTLTASLSNLEKC